MSLLRSALRRGFFWVMFLLPGALLRAQSLLPELTSNQPISYDFQTHELVAIGSARLVYKDAILLADDIRYNKDTGVATARGHFSVTRGALRLVARSGSYRLADGFLHVEGLRLGQYPLYVSGDVAEGTRTQIMLTHATVYFREPNRWSPVMRARRLIYTPGQTIRGEGVTLGVGSVHPLYLPHFEQSVNAPLLSYTTAIAGYRHNLGAYAGFGLHLPVTPGVFLGGDLAYYTARGFMFGPSGTYELGSGDTAASGSFSSGYIDDHGDRSIDVLGRPVPAERAYVTWQQQQQIGPDFTLNGQLNYWKDSAILRDFDPAAFFNVQNPDSFLEGVYTGPNYYVSAFTRIDPNNFEIVQQRLPEIRFDLVPTPIVPTLGLYERFSASFAALRETDPLGIVPPLNSNRFDAYYGLSRPIMPSPWLTLTPVAGARVTYYGDATGGRADYTRVLGEVGIDGQLRASGVYDYKNALWGIDGIRHLITPNFSYRYIPEADKGQAFIPPIDTEAFSTYLPPLDLGDQRNIDQLQAENVLRLGLDNTFQTRDPVYGSRDLLTFNLANDFYFTRQPGQDSTSALQAELAFTPVRWLRLSVYQRLDVPSLTLRELNTGLTLIDTDWWTVRIGTHFLQHQFEDYILAGSLRLNEVYRAFARLDYDKFSHRLNEQTYGITQRLADIWDIDYGVSLYSGPRRESPFGFSISVNLIRF